MPAMEIKMGIKYWMEAGYRSSYAFILSFYSFCLKMDVIQKYRKRYMNM